MTVLFKRFKRIDSWKLLYERSGLVLWSDYSMVADDTS